MIQWWYNFLCSISGHRFYYWIDNKGWRNCIPTKRCQRCGLTLQDIYSR